MPGISLFTSNKLELLVNQLAAVIETDPLPVFEKEVIVVQRKGMQHWLSLKIAERNGIHANTSFPFPKAFVNSLFGELINFPDKDPYHTDFMTWRIMNALPGLLNEAEFSSLKRYCEEDRQELKLFQLSEKIANLFDNYLVYRPDLINQWDKDQNPLSGKSGDSRWQYLLWRAITEPERSAGCLTHAAELRLQFLTREKPLKKIPQRISVFGISSLPPYYLDILKKLAEQISVFIYYLNPCQQFWEYSYSEREISHFLKAGIEEEQQYFEKGNPLLASMGVAGREFFSLILNSLEDIGEQNFVEPESPCLLNRVQADILNLIDRNSDNQIFIDPEDRSLQIHSCHAPIREVEVLYDNLLRLFAENEELSPKDVVVMMPDVSIYAPLIRAVFDAQESETATIPYSISDISLDSTSVIADTFLSVLSLNSERFKAPDVMDILESQAVRDKFEFSEDDIDLIKTWIKQSGIRWGVDGKHKEKLGLPSFEENTWQFGLKRLLLGIALPENDSLELFAGISPYPDMEGDETLILGRFVRFIEYLITINEQLEIPKNLEDWSVFLNDLLSELFANNEQTENELQETREILLENGLLGLQKVSGYQKAVPLSIITAYLQKRLASQLRSTGFISRGVTFCTLLPMRSIPFKVIYILGMNDGDFPRSSPKIGFDLTDREKRLCDRSKRDEDKYLFLESLLSARDHLFISYIGQDIADNGERPPSVLVAELCDTLSKSFRLKSGKPLLEKVITKHPLQPFSPAYFDQDSSLFSYSKQNLEAAEANATPEKKEKRFLSGIFPEPAIDDWSNQTLEQFCRFFSNPAEFILRNRLNIQPKLNDSFQIEDREPFELDNLQRYQLKEDFISYYLEYPEEQTFFEALKAKGELLHGTPGKMVFDVLKWDAAGILKVITGFDIKSIGQPLAVQFNSENHPLHLGGVLRNLSEKGQVFYRSAKIKARDILTVWIYHLMMCRIPELDFPRETFFIATDKVMKFLKLDRETATGEMENLVNHYLQGVTNPLPFFPQSSLAFAESYLKKKQGDEQTGCTAAKKSWYSGYNFRGEQENEAFRLCFGESFPWNDSFKQAALHIYQPVFEYSEEKKLDEFIQST